MKEVLSHLIESLRDELKEYGEMLALLDQQEQHAGSQPAHLRQYAAILQTQFDTATVARREREQRQRQVIRQLGLSEATTFVELLPYLPADYRPLLQALVQENQESLDRARQHARQHQLLLNRVAELMQGFHAHGLCDQQLNQSPQAGSNAPLPEPALPLRTATLQPATVPVSPDA